MPVAPRRPRDHPEAAVAEVAVEDVRPVTGELIQLSTIAAGVASCIVPSAMFSPRT